MTVEELITILRNKPQDLTVAFRCYSEQLLLEEKDIVIESHCVPRKDGWVHSKRPDKPTQDYLVFPGN